MNIFKDTMSEMTYEQVEKLVAQEAIVLFPVGIIEEHGFSGPSQREETSEYCYRIDEVRLYARKL